MRVGFYFYLLVQHPSGGPRCPHGGRKKLSVRLSAPSPSHHAPLFQGWVGGWVKQSIGLMNTRQSLQSRWNPCSCSLPSRLVSSRVGQSLARLGAEVVGVDPSPENVAVASAHAQGDPQTRTIRYEAATAEELETRGKENRGQEPTAMHPRLSSEQLRPMDTGSLQEWYSGTKVAKFYRALRPV